MWVLSLLVTPEFMGKGVMGGSGKNEAQPTVSKHA